MAKKNLFYKELDSLKNIGDNIRLSKEFGVMQVRQSLQNYCKGYGKKISSKTLDDCYLLTLISITPELDEIRKNAPTWATHYYKFKDGSVSYYKEICGELVQYLEDGSILDGIILRWIKPL